MTLTMHRIRTKKFRSYDLTKQREKTNAEVDEAFNNMDTMNKELRRIAEFQGAVHKRMR